MSSPEMVAAAILGRTEGDPSTRLDYGVMATASTVFIAGSTVAVPADKLVSVGALVASDHVALLLRGGDALIIGKVA